MHIKNFMQCSPSSNKLRNKRNVILWMGDPIHKAIIQDYFTLCPRNEMKKKWNCALSVPFLWSATINMFYHWECGYNTECFLEESGHRLVVLPSLVRIPHYNFMKLVMSCDLPYSEIVSREWIPMQNEKYTKNSFQYTTDSHFNIQSYIYGLLNAVAAEKTYLQWKWLYI